MNLQERNALLKDFSGATVYFPRFAKAYSTVQDAIEMSLITGSPNSAIICGPSGAGKTTLCEHLIAHYQRTYEEESSEGVFRRKTVMYFEVPEPATVRQLVEQMLHTLSVTECKGSIAHLTAMLITRLHTLGVEVVFLDEIQRLCTTSTEKIRPSALGWIASFCNDLKKPVVLAGTEECRFITKTPNCEPFANRYPHMVVLNFFTYEAQLSSEYHRTLEKLNETLNEISPMLNEVHLHDADIAAPLFVATCGNIKWLRTVIYSALAHSLKRTAEHGLCRADFSYACDQLDLLFNLYPGNPFSLDLTQARDLISESEKELAKLRVRE
ncbi:TniB family NTP-binding protein [Pseudomonas viridiflava]|uniref:TniB family NTP-binding protein n=1 Tax=Pseudomonas viridiflava TaxID=33069 RepID=UPI000F04DFC8|nr:TniB family NTP-binding protein [Pseudomonas viridiflava]